MQFSELELEPLLYKSIQDLKYDVCTPIQAACLDHVLNGRDISGLAQTGTGKTAAFLVPLIDRILKAKVPMDSVPEEKKQLWAQRSFSEWKAQNFILILVPTRELAEQVQSNLEKLCTHCGLKGFAIYGGTSYDNQKEAIKNGLEFIVATPGRLIDLYKEHFIDLKQVRAVVFDEADRMFDMGFKDDMKYILSRVPNNRQFLVFSATLNFDVLNTAYQFGAEPIEIDVSRDQAKAENVKDEIFHVGHNDKPMYLLTILKKVKSKQTIIFSNFKFSVEKIARFLSENGYPAMAISSLLSQAQRNRVIEQFKAVNESNIMVATDVAARGLDIKGVDLVINFELPNDAESYVHRIGRTGRAGSEGSAYSLVSDKDVDSLARIEAYLKHKLPIGWLEESELVREFKNVKDDEDNRQKPFKPRSQSTDKRFERRDNRHPRDRDNRNFRDRDNRDGDNRDRDSRGNKDYKKPREFDKTQSRSKYKDSDRSKDQGPQAQVQARENSRDKQTGDFKGRKNFDPKFKGKKPEHKPRHQISGTNSAKPAGGPIHRRPLKAKSITGKVKSFFKKLFSN